MQRIRKVQSPDGVLKLIVARGNDGAQFVTFEGSSWHGHADGISDWLSVPEIDAFSHLENSITSDGLPIIVSTDAGATIDPWISDNLGATIEYFGEEDIFLRLWSGRQYSLEGKS